MSEDEIHSAVDACAELLTKDEVSPVVPGLRIWRDGQLIFAESGDSDSLDAAESLDQHSGSIVIAVSETAGTQPDPAPKLRNGESFALPAPIGNVSRDLPAPEVAEDQDVFLIVETLSSLRADVRQFQQSGRISDSDSGGTERVSPPDADLMPDPDSLISRALRRLDDRTTVADSPLVALQIAPDAHGRRAAADSEVTAEAASSPDLPHNSVACSRACGKIGDMQRSRQRPIVEVDRRILISLRNVTGEFRLPVVSLIDLGDTVNVRCRKGSSAITIHSFHSDLP